MFNKTTVITSDSLWWRILTGKTRLYWWIRGEPWTAHIFTCLCLYLWIANSYDPAWDAFGRALVMVRLVNKDDRAFAVQALQLWISGRRSQYLSLKCTFILWLLLKWWYLLLFYIVYILKICNITVKNGTRLQKHTLLTSFCWCGCYCKKPAQTDADYYLLFVEMRVIVRNIKGMVS